MSDEMTQQQDSGPGAGVLKAGVVLVALAVGFVVGLLARAVLWLSSAFNELLWVNLGESVNLPLFPLLVCLAGGCAIGLFSKFCGGEPAALETVLQSVRNEGRYEVASLPKSIIGFLLPLTLGGSVGPEAGLTGLIATGCSWISKSLKAAGHAGSSAVEMGFAASVSAIFGAPLAGFALLGEGEDPSGFSFKKPAKIVLYIAAAFGAFGGILLFGAIAGGGSGLPRFDVFTFQADDLIAVIPCILAAYLMALFWLFSERVLEKFSAKLGERKFLKALTAGAVLGLLALAFPLVLFSGEHQMAELMDSWSEVGAAILLATAFLKLFATSLCLNFGWQGGHFFPNIFAGVACGYGLAALLGVDPLFCVAITTAAFMACAMRRPIIVICLLFLCFPAHGVIWMGLAAFIGAALPVPKRLLKRS